jgi:hypothetical protein
MTGQVKEDILSRFGELGVFVSDGQLFFDPCMLRKTEFLEQLAVFEYVDLDGSTAHIQLEKNSLGFTYCQVPIQYIIAEKEEVQLVFRDDSQMKLDGLTLDKEHSSELFGRTGHIKLIKVGITEKRLK